MPYTTIFRDTVLVPPRWFDLRIGHARIGVDHCQIELLLLAWGFGAVLVVVVVVEVKFWWTTKTRKV
jgi:hypothetical protein